MQSRGTHRLMPRTRRGAVLFWSALFILSIALQYAAAALPKSALATGSSVTICHRTDSNTNPYTNPTVDISSSGHLQGGHDNEHEGPIWNPGLKDLKIEWGDIIPAYEYQPAEGPLFVYPGQNWPAGEALLKDGCEPNLAMTVDKGVSLSASGPFVAGLTTTTGTTLHYRITITNTGNLPLSAVTLSDNTYDLAAKGCVVPATLAVGAHYDCNYTATAVTGTTTNVATGDTAETDADTGTATVEAAPAGEPELTIVKSVSATGADGSWVDQLTTTTGATVHYKITITNTGSVPLTDVSVSDDNFNLEECDFPSTLAVDADADCTYTAVATTGEKVNTATATSEETGKVSDTATVLASTEPPAPTLVIEKTNSATLTVLPGTDVAVPAANEGALITFTLTFTFTGNSASHGVIIDYLPEGLSFVEGSATANNGELYFDGYDEATHSLAWYTDDVDVTKSGVFTYQATVDEGAAELEQPLENVVSIISDDTEEDTSFSVVFVQVAPLAETSAPSAPPTDLLASSGTSTPGGSLMLLLLALVGLGLLIVVIITPMPTSIRSRIRRR